MDTTHESTGPGGDSLSAVSRQFRTHNGLADHPAGEPTDPATAAELKRTFEPEGGYGNPEADKADEPESEPESEQGADEDVTDDSADEDVTDEPESEQGTDDQEQEQV